MDGYVFMDISTGQEKEIPAQSCGGPTLVLTRHYHDSKRDLQILGFKNDCEISVLHARTFPFGGY